MILVKNCKVSLLYSRLQNLASEQSAQLTAAQSELEGLQQENAVLRSSQESTLFGVNEREGKSLQLSQDIADLSRQNEQSYRKLNEVLFPSLKL